MQRDDSVPQPRLLHIEADYSPAVSKADSRTDLRLLRVEEYLQARSLSVKTQRAYRQDLQHFLRWTDKAWAAVTARQITQFKTHLLRTEDGERVLSDATVKRILGTLKAFYGWLWRSGYVDRDPTLEVQLPKLAEPEADNLTDEQVEKILAAVIGMKLCDRNLALFAVLQHGIRAEAATLLNVGDFDGKHLWVRQDKADSKGVVPLDDEGVQKIQAYLGWRVSQGEVLQPESPLFVSASRRNRGARIGYDTIDKLVCQLREQTGIEFHAHQFRHTYATNLVLDGMNPYHVMTLTRHKSVQSFRRYTKAADQQAAEAAFYETKRRKHKTEPPLEQ
ncbi:tyrosine-type recombinase/integrase [Myxacorys almedinensis]|uniref:Tyrosine-type recombinase/integrase n=1 Tax=Myxacorys almedinensis A TaxID=2690445 RepID=A0A8J7ZAR6_9CYAN|nr:tyrosine-type recombinase/integrase [Myxacorys almedinensis]NDJ18540.1 tyrosine-type recombinase/integrase [Myxacorys almedinensis A]